MQALSNKVSTFDAHSHRKQTSFQIYPQFDRPPLEAEKISVNSNMRITSSTITKTGEQIMNNSSHSKPSH